MKLICWARVNFPTAVEQARAAQARMPACPHARRRFDAGATEATRALALAK
eukprot:SAG22_NODE_17752_length_299_cov_0.765000_1_plen_50_part_10